MSVSAAVEMRSILWMPAVRVSDGNANPVDAAAGPRPGNTRVDGPPLISDVRARRERHAIPSQVRLRIGEW